MFRRCWRRFDFLLTFYACTMGMVNSGGCARNFWQVTMAEYETLLKWTIPVNIFYMLSSDFAKLSLLFSYLQLSPDRGFRLVVKGLITCFLLYAIIYSFVSIFSCQPVHASWDLVAMTTAKCINKPMFYLAASIANVLMDIIILLVPLRIVIPLQIPRWQKIPLLFLFATGGFVIMAAIRNCLLTVALFASDNYTWGLAYELCWMYGELACCVICSSASSLKPFFVRYLPALVSSRFNTSYGKSYRGITIELSQGTRNGRHLSHRQPDAYELESDSDSVQGKKVPDDDEAKLWSGAEFRRQGAGTTTRISTSKEVGIDVVHTMEISYSLGQADSKRQVNVPYETTTQVGRMWTD
ncbi:hypothetical protein GGR57DRAFT_481286 [Xylariaceae sp. FL1272]|nr:hypothetical protein GGR57DRAFT_481286 [Xylariaceae sp. FL1272]